MKNVQYVGSYEAFLPTISKYVNPGDVIEVEDDFDNVLFVLVEENVPEAPTKETKTKGENK
jgi:hypothetical protein